MCIDCLAAVVHTDLFFPPDELPGADPAPCEGCDGYTSGRICPCGEEQPGWSWGRDRWGLPVARVGLSRDAPCRALPPFTFVVLLPRVVASPSVALSLEVSGFSPALLLQRLA